MIYESGILYPTAKQKKLIASEADESFCATLRDFEIHFKGHKKYVLSKPPIALCLKNVQPHDDPWVGDNLPGDIEDGYGGPEKRISLFWVTHLKEYQSLYIQVANQYAQLKQGDYILFDDSKVHSVICDYKWKGVACQLREVK